MDTQHDPSSATPPGESPRDALIESIYRIALEPQSYDSFMGQWDAYITERIEALEALAETTPEAAAHPDIARHFDIALQLLEQTAPPPPEGRGETRGVGDPQMLVNAEGRIVWSNAAATRLFDLSRNSDLDDLGLPDAQAQAARRLAAQMHRADLPASAPLVLRAMPPGVEDPIDMAARILPPGSGAAEPLLAVSRLAPRWPAAMDQMLVDAFGLSPTETRICELLADGQNPARIAETRESALSTVRTQIKAVLAKMRCRSQVDLVRLIHALMRVAEEHRPPPAPAGGLVRIALAGRDMPVEQHGDPKGRPVIFFHGMLDGNAVNLRCRLLLEQAGLRMICPVRPFFGSAPGEEGSPLEAPARFARDVEVLIDRMKLRDPVLLGHMAGAAYAFAAAAALPEGAVRGVISVSGAVPIVARSQFTMMSRRQRLVAYTAKYAPSILPFVLRAGISQIHGGGDRRFLHSLYENSPRDMELLRDPEIAAIVLDGYRFTIAQGHRAFEIDSHTVVRDWSATALASDCPVHLLHGESDPVVAVASVRGFSARLGPRARLSVLRETGQLVLYKEPETVIAAIREMQG